MANGMRWIRLAGILGLLFQTSALALPPGNDAFLAPAGVIGLPTTASGTNRDATLEVGETPPSESAQASVWFQWTSPISGPVRIDTKGSDFDTLLAVWAGDELTTLALIADNDDFWGVQSEVELNAVAGVTYQIAVYGYGKYRGAIALNIGQNAYGRISGKVTGPDGNTPLEGVGVEAFCWSGASWNFVKQELTDWEGRYLLADLPVGTYRVWFRDASGFHVAEWHSNSHVINGGTDIPVLEMVTGSGIDATLAVASHVSGRVTGPDGTTPLPNIRVTAIRDYLGEWQWGWDGEWENRTDADGNYMIGGLPAGSYMVRFLDDAGTYEYEMYPDTGLFSDSHRITVPAETSVTNINAALGPAASIAGTVTGPDGEVPLAGISVQAMRSAGSWWEAWLGAETGADGGYTIRGLRPGTYRLRFTDRSGAIACEVYDDSPTLAGGTNIVVAAEDNVGGINASMGGASSISGTVTGPDGLTPLGGIEVWVDQWDGAWWEDEIPAIVQTGTNGSYRVSGLATGTYRVRFFDKQKGDYVSEVYDSVRMPGTGTDVAVGTEANVGNVDASLEAAARISGTVTGSDGMTPLDGIKATAYWWNGAWYEDNSRWAMTDPNGHYTIAGLPSGTYRVDFQDVSGLYMPETYANVRNFDAGTEILAPPAVTVTGIDASLELGSRISGRVTGADGATPIAGIRVSAARLLIVGGRFAGAQYGGDCETDVSGNYSIGGLRAGTYAVQFWDGSGAWASEVYDDSAFFPGTGVVVRAATAVSGIDASMGPASRIEGMVTGPGGTTPLADVSVTVFRLNGLNWENVDGAGTTANGSYSIGGLSPGTYRVFFREMSGTYAYETYADAGLPENGTDVPVPEATTVSGINVTLGPASRIEGVVTDPDGSNPLAGIMVAVLCQKNGQWEYFNNSQTDAAGRYSIAGLRAGAYRVFFTDPAGTYAFETYDDTDYPENGLDVVVFVETTHDGVDASLGLASRIEGTVTGPGGTTPLAGIEVFALRWNGSQWVGLRGTGTGADGRFSISGLRAGTYRVGFQDSNDVYIFELFSNAYSVENGADIVVPAATTVGGTDVSLSETGTSVPATITGFRRVDVNTFELLFTGVPGQQYLLRKTASLAMPWDDHGAPILCAPGKNAVTLEPSGPARFWSLETVP